MKKQMKKQMLVLFAATLILTMAVSVLALAPVSYKSYNIKAVHKNPTTWNTIGGGNANIMLSHGVKNQMVEFRAKAILKGLEPLTNYSVIYYGNLTQNDVWPVATCITSAVTDKNGNARTPEGVFDYSSFINDGINQKFWVVPSSDLDCVNHKLIAWNPTRYLFETKTI